MNELTAPKEQTQVNTEVFTFNGNPPRTHLAEDGVVWVHLKDVFTAIGYESPTHAITNLENTVGNTERGMQIFAHIGEKEFETTHGRSFKARSLPEKHLLELLVLAKATTPQINAIKSLCANTTTKVIETQKSGAKLVFSESDVKRVVSEQVEAALAEHTSAIVAKIDKSIECAEKRGHNRWMKRRRDEKNKSEIVLNLYKKKNKLLTRPIAKYNLMESCQPNRNNFMSYDEDRVRQINPAYRNIHWEDELIEYHQNQPVMQHLEFYNCEKWGYGVPDFAFKLRREDFGVIGHIEYKATRFDAPTLEKANFTHHQVEMMYRKICGGELLIVLVGSHYSYKQYQGNELKDFFESRLLHYIENGIIDVE